MLLSPGDKLGPYEILARLGAGGMGEVYKARDTRLSRDVAVKVSAAQFSERFEREARSIAALNHPNICQLYDVGPRYLVMEFVAGAPLTPADSMRKLLDLAVQITDGMAAAHAGGIIHRDLKPDNIFVTLEGRVKILDFGLAKAVVAESTADQNTRTITITAPGTAVGTVAYMSPEQARGDDQLSVQSDQFSFGLILYELLAKKRAFNRASKPEIMAAIIGDEAEPLPADIPVPLRWIVERLLSKEASERYDSTRDLYRELRQVRDRLSEARANTGGAVNNKSNRDLQTSAQPFVDASRTEPSQTRHWPSRQEKWATAIVLAVVSLTGTVIVGWPRLQSDAISNAPIILSVLPSPDTTLKEVGSSDSAPEISPDGFAILYAANGRLEVRRLDSIAPRVVPGSDGFANPPFWSPDSTTVVFPVTNRLQLLKVRLPDGAPQPIAPLRTYSRGGTWSESGTVLISALGVLLAVPASGGELRPVEMPGPLKEGRCLYPEFLPGTEDFSFIFVPRKDPEDAAVYLATLHDGRAVDPTLLLKNQTTVRYTPVGGGRMLFVRNDNLYAQKLNRRTRRLEGEAELVARGVASQPSLNVNRADFSVARNGTVVWRPGKAALSQVTVFDRKGTAIGTAGPFGSWDGVVLSPDERQLLVESEDGWCLLEAGESGRLDLPKDVDWIGFSGGGSRLIGAGRGAFWEMSASGAGEVHELRKPGPGNHISDISADGKWLIATNTREIFSLPLTGVPEKATTRVVAEKDVLNFGPHFSPDGHWIVYERRDPQAGLYVQPFPGPGARRQIAPSGEKAIWRRDGKEILYLDKQTVMSVAVETVGAKLHFGASHPLFSGLREPPGMTASSFPIAVSRDGSRIFWLKGAEQPNSNMIYIKTGWAK